MTTVNKHVCIITGTRAEYAYLKLLMKKIEESEYLNLSVIVTGMHLLQAHGHTIDIIRADGIPITRIIPMYDEKDHSLSALGVAVGRAIMHFAEVFEDLNPDLIMVLGDRYEPLAAVVAASTLKIPVAHIHGGDISGTVDENIRHAITKLSHLHFPATPKSAERIRRMGEEQWRIYMFGSTTIDNLVSEPEVELGYLEKKYGLNLSEKLVICLQHPNVYESEKAGEQMKLTLQVLEDLDLQTIIIYPNNDLGSELMIREIEKKRGLAKFKIFKNIERKDYIGLLKHADLLIGNSSGGLIETPFLKLPVVNIGTRNKDREAAGNVINVDHDYDEIRLAVLKALSREFKEACRNIENPYGNGTASDKIVRFLENLEIDERLLIKKLTYDV